MAKSYPQFVLLGDSLFEQSVTVQGGFSLIATLQDRFIRRLDVVNRGLSGWNTKNVLDFLTDIFPEPSHTSPRIEYLVVLLGANDAVIPLDTTSQHVPPETYKENLFKIVNHPHIRFHNPKILLVTPPPADEIKLAKLDMAEGHVSSIRTSAITACYAEKAREVARENAGIVLIDLWQAIMDVAIAKAPDNYQPGGPWLGSPENGNQGGLDQLLPDGLHMGGEAYRILYEALKPHIGYKVSGDKEGYVYPDWRVLNLAKRPLVSQ